MTQDAVSEAPQAVSPAWLTALAPWLRARGHELAEPLVARQIAGGYSNLTYLVEDSAGRRLVYRRPPLGGVLASAHDVVREGRIMKALRGTSVPVPEVLGVNEDVEVAGSPFVCMDFVDGHVLRDSAVVEQVFPVEARVGLARSFVEALAAVHRVDPTAVGLGDLGPEGSYLERQMRRWERQLAASVDAPIPAADTLLAALKEQVPATARRCLVHADFRLDNTIIGSDGQVRAVLDWELATLGDPLADLGTVLAFWFEPGERVPNVLADVPQLTGFPTRAELVEWYAQSTGFDTRDAEYYRAFALWRLAAILAGVGKRFRAGVMGDSGEGPTEEDVVALAEMGHASLLRHARSVGSARRAST